MSYKELNWIESFPIELGSYITLNQNSILWKPDMKECEQIYQFSAQSETCCNSYCTTRSIHLIDFRYATLILSDIGHTLHEPYTSTTIAEVCMYMKKFARNDFGGHIHSVIDGVVISAINGIHIVLFDMDCVKYTRLPTYEYGTLLEPSPIKIARNINTRFFIVNGPSSNPIRIVIPEGCIYNANADAVTKWDFIKLEMLGFRHPNHHLHSRKSMNVPIYQTLILNKPFLPVYGSLIDLPENTIFFRGYDTKYPSISNRPAYFGNRHVAEEYANASSSHDIGYFATTKQIKLIDIRFLKVLLKDLLDGYHGDIVKKTTIAFGLCSFSHQLHLMKDVYAEAISKNKEFGYNSMLKELDADGDLYMQKNLEKPGVRVAETSNDGWVMAVLREIFDGVADGFISPELKTPYQYNTNYKLHPELIVFNPEKSGIIELNVLPNSTFISVPDLIRDKSPVVLQAYGMKTSYIGCGRTRKLRHKHNRTHKSGCIYIPAIELFNDMLNRGDPDAIQQYNEAIEEGKKMRKYVSFSYTS